MKKILKLSTRDQNIFLVADLHYDHDRDFIWKDQGYDSVYSRNDHIKKSWCNTVTENDIVINLGDTIFKDGTGQNIKSLLPTLKCKKHYILFGNHISGVKQIYDNKIKEMGFPEGTEYYPLEIGNTVFVGDYLELRVDGRLFVLSHFPIESWHDVSKGAIHLHGHCHGNLQTTMKNRIDVGWHLLKRPISIKEIVQMANSTDGGLPSDHHREEL